MHRIPPFLVSVAFSFTAINLCAPLTSQLAATPIPAGTAFTYQGKLSDSGVPFTGLASFRFRLFDAAAGGSQVGVALTTCDVTVTDGVFTVTLDFGATAFNGGDRWLEIGAQTAASNCTTFVTLSPRQAINAAPYAIRSFAPWATNGTAISYTGGKVGIGVTAPTADLEISNLDAAVRLESTSITGTSSLTLIGEYPGGFTSNTLGAINFGDGSALPSDPLWASIYSAKGVISNPLNFAVQGTPALSIDLDRDVGIGTTLPVAKLHVQGGSDSAPSGGGYAILGDPSGLNISLDNNEIMARNNGTAAVLTLNNDGGNILLCPQGNSSVGIGTTPLSSTILTVYDSLAITGVDPRLDIGQNGFILLNTGADLTITNGGLEVNTPSGGSTYFNRVAADGTLVNFYNAGAYAGGIAVLGTTVSYNAFTGSHHAWTDEKILSGTLVALTGANRNASNDAHCEPVYGVAPTTQANDPSVLGAYLAPPDPLDPSSRHLVASVGNGEMWVVDRSGEDLCAGDYLISSDVAGCAMRDDHTRFAIGHIVARVAEPIIWSDITPGRDGTRRALVSVLFESFDRHGDAHQIAAEFSAIRAENESLRSENDELRQRLDAIERAVRELTPRSIGGTP